MLVYLFIALGCSLGGVCRHLGSTLCGRYWGKSFPLGTLVVNLVGSFLLGVTLGADLISASASEGGKYLYGFLAVGFCGGLTTFSTFSLESLTLLSQQAKGKLAANIGGSVVGCMICVAAGFSFMKGMVS